MQGIDRSKKVIVYKTINSNDIHCRVCTGYTGDIHGQCPCFPWGTCGNGLYDPEKKPPPFNNTKHIAIAILGYPCSGRQFGCLRECDSCVIVKRKLVFRGDNK